MLSLMRVRNVYSQMYSFLMQLRYLEAAAIPACSRWAKLQFMSRDSNGHMRTKITDAIETGGTE